MAKSQRDHLLRRMLDAPPLPLVQKTPVSHAQGLSRRVNQPVFIKREDLQKTHSFKLRGAMEKMGAEIYKTYRTYEKPLS